MMKPQNLKHPFTWEQRRVLVKDRVWFVPNCLENDPFQFPGWFHPEFFGNDLPVQVEYCSGNGEWIAKKAVENPQFNWVAIEKRFDRTRLIWSKIKKYKIDNLLVICGEGYEITSRYFKENSINHVFINFPDPWPKRRHAKHRMIRDPFFEQLQRILKPQGILTFVTDDIDYSEYFNKTIQQHTVFLQTHASPYTTHVEGYGSSFFDQLWRQKGKEIRYHVYQKQHVA